MKHNRTHFQLDHPAGVKARVFRSAPRFSETPTNVRRVPPVLGEHTEEVLASAGLDADAIARAAKGTQQAR